MNNPKIIACRVVLDEMRPFLPEGIATEVFEISLHTRPKFLRETLQDAVSAADGKYDPILLAYGMCSRAVVGLVAQHSHLVVPRGDDCIGLFLGSQRARHEHALEEPGTYFLTGGWIGDGSGSPFTDYDRMVARYGAERAEALMGKMMRHYDHLTYIRMPNRAEVESDRAYARGVATRFGLEYVEIEGTARWLERLVAGDWRSDFVVTAPGEPISLEHFLAEPAGQAPAPTTMQDSEAFTGDGK